MSKRYVTRFSLVAFLLFFLATFVVACGSSTASTPPKPAPTPAATLTIYKGTGYSIGYPKGWTLNQNGEQTQISDAAQDIMGIQTAKGSYPTGSVSNQLIQTIMQSVLNLLKQGTKDYKELNVPSTTSIGGITWYQKAATMTDPKLGPVQFNVLYTQNPKSSGQLFVMFYGTTLKTYDKINSEAFQPMLKSFQFQA